MLFSLRSKRREFACLSTDPNREAFGAAIHGSPILLFPGLGEATHLRSAYIELLRSKGWPHSEREATFADSSEDAQEFLPVNFLVRGGHGLINFVHTSACADAATMSDQLGSTVIKIQPLGKGAIWTYTLFSRGHLIDRFASWPEWIPDSNIGDLEFDAYVQENGRSEAVKEYLPTWKGDVERIAELFGVAITEIAPYMRQFTNEEMQAYRAKGNYSELKVHPEDRYSFASPWVLLHFIERLGFSGFRDWHWSDASPPPPWSAASLLAPYTWSAPEGSPTSFRPPCTEFCSWGFFRSHDAVCKS